MIRFQTLAILCAVLTSQHALANGNSECISDSNLSISTISPRMAKDRVLSVFGTPSKETMSVEGIEVLFFSPKTHVAVFDGRVFQIVTSSDRHATPSGIRVGMSAADIATHVDFPKERIESEIRKYREVQLVSCSDEFTYLVISVDESDRIQEIRIGFDLP